MTIKAQTKDKNSNFDKRQLVLLINTGHYISHKECTTYIFVKWRTWEIII